MGVKLDPLAKILIGWLGYFQNGPVRHKIELPVVLL